MDKTNTDVCEALMLLVMYW